METKARTARQRAREQITAEILTAARAQLATVGPGELSLRAVARDVGMVSSAVYRYFPSRDELLTALLIDAYDDLGRAVEEADETVADRADTRSRWTACCRAVRSWALAHPHDYALLYGSPVTGYAAPHDTVAPATRVIVRLVQVIVAAHAAGSRPPVPPADAPAGFAEAVGDATAAIKALTEGIEGLGGIDEVNDLDELPAELVGRSLMAWSSLFGVVSFELWGHLAGSVTDHEAYFDGVVARLWDDLGGV